MRIDKLKNMKYLTKHYVYVYTYDLLLMGKQFKEM